MASHESCESHHAHRVLAMLKRVIQEHSFFGDGSHGAGINGTRAVFASAPGRIELAGNHVDHQGGKTISAAFDKRCYAVARANGTQRVRMVFSGFGTGEIDLTQEDWDKPRDAEKETSVGLVRGIMAGYVHRGGTLSGFDMVTYSDIPVGCGVSSSAAFEVCIGGCISALFDPSVVHEPVVASDPSPASFSSVASDPSPTQQISLDPGAIAHDAVKAEQDYFGKPCGAQDQTASAYGEVLCLDFQTDPPCIEHLPYPLADAGYTACLIDSRCNHALFTADFAAIPHEMDEVARFFGATRLHDVDERTFLAKLPAVRAALGDRPVLRALHYYNEVRRVERQAEALTSHNVTAFLQNVLYSGASSAQYLQNVELPDSDAQTLLLIMALCDTLLEGKGAWRIHGGGFGGSIIVFLPSDEVESFCATIDQALGYDTEVNANIQRDSACMVVQVGGPGVEAFAVSI